MHNNLFFSERVFFTESERPAVAVCIHYRTATNREKNIIRASSSSSSSSFIYLFLLLFIVLVSLVLLNRYFVLGSPVVKPMINFFYTFFFPFHVTFCAPSSSSSASSFYSLRKRGGLKLPRLFIGLAIAAAHAARRNVENIYIFVFVALHEWICCGT